MVSVSFKWYPFITGLKRGYKEKAQLNIVWNLRNGALPACSSAMLKSHGMERILLFVSLISTGGVTTRGRKSTGMHLGVSQSTASLPTHCPGLSGSTTKISSTAESSAVMAHHPGAANETQGLMRALATFWECEVCSFSSCPGTRCHFKLLQYCL